MALISCAIIVQLICTFVFAYAKRIFSYDVAHFTENNILISCVVTAQLICAFVFAYFLMMWLIWQRITFEHI